MVGTIGARIMCKLLKYLLVFQVKKWNSSTIYGLVLEDSYVCSLVIACQIV